MNFEEGNVMDGTEKVKSFRFRLVVLALVLCCSVCWTSGCGYVGRAGKSVVDFTATVLTLGETNPEAYAQMGETEAEGRRRHLRSQRINSQQLRADLDELFLLKDPSTLTDKRVP
ncbi:MAG: hypothetical protein ACYS4W_00685 [Planctomycetota bacterium]